MNIPLNQHTSNKVIRLAQKIIVVASFFLLFSCDSSDPEPAQPISGFSVGGTVSGLTDTLIIQNNSSNSVQTIEANGRYAFVERLGNGETYNVEIVQNSASQNCSIQNASGQINNANATNVDIVCVVGRLSLSGRYRAAPLIQVDSDINDPLAPANVANNRFAAAQAIANFSTVHGFATLIGTLRSGAGDRLAFTADKQDIYRVALQKNQTIRLQVVDFVEVDIFSGDLDLYLFDSLQNLVASSDSTNEFESLRVPEDGEYFVIVEAFWGSSKYTLSLDGVSALNTSAKQSMDFISGEAVIQFKPNTTVNQFKISNQMMAFSHQDTSRTTRARFSVSASRTLASNQPLAATFLQELASTNPVSYQKYQTLKQIKHLNQRVDVTFAEPNYIRRAFRVPNDTFYPRQWHYPAINLPLAWNITTGSRIGGGEVIVAVVDTGVFLAHPEFVGQLVAGYDFISDAGNAADGNGIDPNPDDPGDGAQLNSSSWHGTHVAGTVAALSNNNSGIAGVAWDAKIMPLRVLGVEGGSSHDIIQAIRFAAGLTNDSNTVPAQKADVINLSLGGGGFSQAEQNVFNEVRAAGVIVVAAAGNENTRLSSFPASYEGVISVSATGFDNSRAPYSNFGGNIDVAAPGGNQAVDLNADGHGDGVLSTLVDDSTGTRNSTFDFYQGTSMAAPHVAGVIALMRAVHPALSPDDIDSLLSAGAITTDIGAVGRDDQFGFGLIDALRSVQAAQTLANGGDLPPQPALIVAEPAQVSLGLGVTAALTLTNLGEMQTSVVSFSADVSWLTISASGNVDGNGLGEYLIVIDRTGLNDSLYLATITFTLATGGSVSVQVSMQVGELDSTGHTGAIYMLLLDENNHMVAQGTTMDLGNGVFSYSFVNLVSGSYRIVAGSDIDNDLLICQLAEACGGFPTLNALTTVVLSDIDISGLDFVVDILANFGTSRLSAEASASPAGFQRAIIESKQVKLAE